MPMAASRMARKALSESLKLVQPRSTPTPMKYTIRLYMANTAVLGGRGEKA